MLCFKINKKLILEEALTVDKKYSIAANMRDSSKSIKEGADWLKKSKAIRNNKITKDTLTKDTLTKDTLTKDTLTKDTLTKDTLTKDTPTKDTPTKDTPSSKLKYTPHLGYDRNGQPTIDHNLNSSTAKQRFNTIR